MSPSAHEFLSGISPFISVITKIELLSRAGIPLVELGKLHWFIDSAVVFPLDDVIVNHTITLRKLYRLKTPDAIIASTAVVQQLTLLTSNTRDFTHIAKLAIIDPMTL